jgi:hypothetical protein
MKIKVEGEKIIKAVKKLNSIEIVVENPDDAKEAIHLIFAKIGLFEKDKSAELKDFNVSAFQRYETSAVNYKMIFLLEFFFEESVSLEKKVALIKELQEFFDKV